MTKKTLYKIFAFAVSVITITAILILSVFYSYSDKQLKEQLLVVENVVEAELMQNGNTDFITNHIDKSVRITLVANDGTVIADNQEDVKNLDNHLQREEIKEAIENGEATVSRYSDTQKGKAVIIAAVFVSVAITKSIVKPITQLGKNLDNIDEFKADEEFKPLINALLEQKKRQKVLDRQKKQFTANVSHELKTPLTSIAGYAELIETGMAKQEDIKPFAGVIRKQALRLVSLSEDIIQLSQLEESDEEEMTFESVNLYEIANRCIEALNINAINKNVTLNLLGEDCYIRGKAQLVEELVYNLCDNAIRYNKENGSVTVSVTPLERGASISVKDTGIGIPEKYQDRIFVKHITQLHHAQLEINSEEGKGTEIIVTFKD